LEFVPSAVVTLLEITPGGGAEYVRILVVGAGAIGGYFGGRLLEAGADVAFLVRPRRAEQLQRDGLVIRSRYGDFSYAAPATVTADALSESYDLVLLSVKAYDLDDALESLAPAVGSDTAILPLLNGMAHLDRLTERFGSQHVLGGLCMIAVTLDADGSIRHLNDNHNLAFGERDRGRSARVLAIESLMQNVRFAARLSDDIIQEMWEKWAFIASAAGITCLMRAAIGDIVAAGAADLAADLYDECASIATQQGHPPGAAARSRSHGMLTAPASLLTASMLRDIESGARIEADHIIGDLLQRGNQPAEKSLLRTAYAQLKAYEARRRREGETPAARA
jgi:2-dehydropantoate 2-reductase